MKRRHVDTWLQSTYPGETLQAYLTGGPGNGTSLDASDAPGSRHPADLQVHIERRGLDAVRRIAPYSNLCAVVSAQRLAIVTTGGLFSVRPRQLLTSAPRGEFRCEWWTNDESEKPSAAYCNVVCFFPDGAWAAIGAPTRLLGKTVAGAALADQFIAVLGTDAAQIDWRNPPPPPVCP